MEPLCKQRVLSYQTDLKYPFHKLQNSGTLFSCNFNSEYIKLYGKLRTKIGLTCNSAHKYRISANSFRGNYCFFEFNLEKVRTYSNLTLCTVTFDHSTYRCRNYSREETIQGRKLFAEIRYLLRNLCFFTFECF